MGGLQEQRERDLVRELARQVAETAAEPRMEAIKQRWRDVNALRKPDRAPVWCRPVGCWKEVLPPESLVCSDPALRGIEEGFRQLLFKRDVDDDEPVASTFDVGAVFRAEPPNRWGLDIERHRPAESDGAWAYDPPLKTPADFDRLRVPAFLYDQGETERRMESTDELLGDILPVRLVCGVPASATLGNAAADLRGLEQMMMDMAVEPELMHRLSGVMRDGVLAAMDAVEASGLLTPNNEGPMQCADPIGEVGADGWTTLLNCWCTGNSQEFDQVSPDMWETFCLEYQRPIFERAGLVAYGCCENLTHKIDGVLSIPNLRVFVCSAWTDLDVVLSKAGPKYCIMWRQKASAVVFPDGESTIRADLEEGARKLQGRPYQVVLRELQTLAGHPDRLHVWTRLAKEAAAKFC